MARFSEYRIKNELKELEIFDNWSFIEINNEEPKFYKKFEFSVQVIDGIFKNFKFTFHIKFFEDYPFRAPKVVCVDPIFHPNIDVNGNVCINFLREDWSCTMGLQYILFGIYIILTEFNGEDALNTEAGNLMVTDIDAYIRKATKKN